MKRVVIIGGGISGLSTAYYLQKEAKEKGVELTYNLIEKKGRLGGNIITEKVDGFIIEGGPDCFIYEKPWVLELCKELGLADRVINTNKDSRTFVLWKGKFHPLPEGFVLMIPTKIMPLITSTLFSFKAKLRMALDLIKPKGDPNKDESLAEFVNRRLGNEALEKIAEPLVAGIHAGNPETMSVKSSFPRFIDMEQKYRSLILGMLKIRKAVKKAAREGKKQTTFMTLKGGLTELVEGVVKELDKNSIITGEGVSSIKKSGDTYIVETEDGKAITADSVIFSTPAYVSAKLLRGLDSSLADNLEKIPYVSTATVSLAFKKTDVKTPLKGFGVVIPRIEKRKIMAASWSSLKFPYRAPDNAVLIRCFVGGSKNEELAYLEEKEMIEMVRTELKEITGIAAEPILTRVFKWKKAMSQRVVGHSEVVRQLDEQIKKHPGVFLTGSAYKGTGLSDSVHNGELSAIDTLNFLT